MNFISLSTSFHAMDLSQETRDQIKAFGQDPTFRIFVLKKLEKSKEDAFATQRSFNARAATHRENLDLMAFEFVCCDDPRQPVTGEMDRNFIVRTAMKELDFAIDVIFTQEEMSGIQSRIKTSKTILAILDEK